jgi:hypothetical protein
MQLMGRRPVHFLKKEVHPRRHIPCKLRRNDTLYGLGRLRLQDRKNRPGNVEARPA